MEKCILFLARLFIKFLPYLFFHHVLKGQISHNYLTIHCYVIGGFQITVTSIIPLQISTEPKLSFSPPLFFFLGVGSEGERKS